MTALDDLEALAGLAALEGHARRADLEALLAVARRRPGDAERARLLAAARAAYGLAAPPAPPGRADAAEAALDGLVALAADPGLEATPFPALLAAMVAAAEALEAERRAGHRSPLEPAALEAVEAGKGALAGRALNAAATAALRGLYARLRALASAR